MPASNPQKRRVPGFDESLLKVNLEMSVEARIVAHDSALEVSVKGS